VAEALDPSRVVADFERYWRETGVPHGALVEMRLQLEQHLTEARDEGRSLSEVIGPSLAEFAETWASEYRDRAPASAWDEVTSGRTARRRSERRQLVLYALAVVAVVAAVAIGSSGGERVDNEIWRWLWTGLAVVMGIGEIFTAGFFLLPFAIGAVAAAVLAWLNVAILAQWLVFFGVSLFALVYLRRFISRQDDREQPRVGANRWANTTGLVLEAIDPLKSIGMVRIGGEEWRATSDRPIPAGTQIVVREVRGAHLVVTPIE
jgi:membrane protein implicated in regulation of membrane protease activity